MTNLEGLGRLTGASPDSLPTPPKATDLHSSSPLPLPAILRASDVAWDWLGTVWLFSAKPRVDRALSSL